MNGQTHPTFHPTLVFSMLDEMLVTIYFEIHMTEIGQSAMKL